MKIPFRIESIIPILLLTAIIGCGSSKKVEPEIKEVKNTYDQIKGLNWIIGNWINKSNDGTITEVWTVLNDSVYSGQSIAMKGNDTVFVESITIQQKGNELYYVPIVADQNDAKPILFKCKDYNKNSPTVVFENPVHDFPQIITYSLIKPDSMVAEISGIIEGVQHVETFPMARKQ